MVELGKDEHAPKNIIDVSLRKEPMPHGTGFLIEGGFVITAAHVVLSPENDRTFVMGTDERVSFASADFRFGAKSSGHYDVVAKVASKVVGKTVVWVQDDEDEDQQIDEEHTDADDNGEPQVDVIVASFGRDDPFALGGIRAGWVEWRFPRRVEFTWFARGSRGWSGTNVAISAFVLDDTGKIVGQGVGCIRAELRPEHTWSCAPARAARRSSRRGQVRCRLRVERSPRRGVANGGDGPHVDQQQRARQVDEGPPPEARCEEARPEEAPARRAAAGSEAEVVDAFPEQRGELAARVVIDRTLSTGTRARTSGDERERRVWIALASHAAARGAVDEGAKIPRPACKVLATSMLLFKHH
jgi:hypothetical protein